MNEVEKMYENAEVKKQIPKICSNNELYCRECEAHIEDARPYCKNAEYPPFTAEKQLELIKWLAKTRPIHITFLIDKWVIEGMVRYGKRYDTFEEAIAGLINNLWQDLTDAERKQIKNILESEARE